MLIHKKLCGVLVGDTHTNHFIVTLILWAHPNLELWVSDSVCVGANVFTRGAINHCKTLCKSHSFLCLENLCESYHFLLHRYRSKCCKYPIHPKYQQLNMCWEAWLDAVAVWPNVLRGVDVYRAQLLFVVLFVPTNKQIANCHSHWKAPSEMYIFSTSTESLSRVNENIFSDAAL